MNVNMGGSTQRVTGDLFIVCNGRNSQLRKASGLETEKFASTADALWLRFDFSDVPDVLPTNVDVQMFGKGRVVVLQTTTSHRLHIAYSEPGNLHQLRKDLPELRRRLLSSVPEQLRSHLHRKLSEQTEWQVLKIVVDRVRSWHSPGALFLGDAAHTMSPAGGQGLNLAIRDTFVAANHILDAIKEGRELDEALLEKIQAERQVEIEAIQARQTRAGQMVLKPLPVLHVMFTMLSLAMKLMAKKFAAADHAPQVVPRYLRALDKI